MSERYISLDGLCQQLSISRATGRNWLRLGKIESQGRKPDGGAYFTEEYVRGLEEALRTGERSTLRSRRNKQYVSGKGLYDRYVSEGCAGVRSAKKLVDKLKEQKVSVTETAMRALLADCALKLLISSGVIISDREDISGISERAADIPRKTEMLQAYIHGEFSAGIWSLLIDDIIHDKENVSAWIGEHRELMNAEYEYQDGEDVPGLLYMSIRDIGSRKATGSYYTPTEVVRRMVSDVYADPGRWGEDMIRIMDPCCGTGNFLIQIPAETPLDNIYACDIDELSVQLARFNLALSRAVQQYPQVPVNIKELNIICEHIACCNFLISDSRPEPSYDLIIGNPPWGSTFDMDMRDYLRSNYKVAVKKGIESYDVFVERSLELLRDGGRLKFVVPEAILEVNSHSVVRQIIAEKTNIERVSFIGDVFHGVQCPAVTLQLVKSANPGHSLGAEIERDGHRYMIDIDRPLTSGIFQVRLRDAEYDLLTRLENAENCTCLRGQADFALGIVTGNNGRYVLADRRQGSEPVVTGADVYRYRYSRTEKYIKPELGIYQQTAPERMYRAPEKLIYRFVNRQLIFAYDDRQRLTLNSCNVVIPRVEGQNMKYIMAVLNSRIAQYIYEKKYNSVKVLRSHIESIPIPLTDEKLQLQIVNQVDLLMKLSLEVSGAWQKRYELYDAIDDMIRRAYGLNDADYEFIKNVLSADKYML